MANTSYNRIVRKLVVGFGNLFNQITLVRYNTDQTEQERFIVPIAYAQKELYVQRLEGDPSLDKKTQMTLPRMSFEMSGLSYDASRKQNTNFKNFIQTPSGVLSQYNPVPYNFDFNLYIYVRNIEDGTQIIEHILPFFTPDYTIKLNLVPEMSVIKEIPVVLNSTTHETTYEGPRDSDPRMIIWTLNFTVKGYVFGATTKSGLITNSITNILTTSQNNSSVNFIMDTGGTGTYQPGEIVYQGYTLGTAVATATVINWNHTTQILQVSNISGNFVSGQIIIGATNNAKWTFNNFNFLPNIDAKISITPNPPTANATDNWTANTQIYEFPQEQPITPPPLPANSEYVICTSLDYGQVRGFRVEIEGIRTFTPGDTLSDGTNIRIIDGTQSDGGNITIALVTTSVPPTWIDGHGPFTLVLTHNS
jgi:hypothetical protein